jgi:REP element-mobilizing transposase RayT
MACCLMRNHFHLVVETPNANLVAGMAWLQSTCTIRLNHRHKLFGHVFSGRYKAQLVEGGGDGYLRTPCDYVHLNPIRTGQLRAEDRLLRGQVDKNPRSSGPIRGQKLFIPAAFRFSCV